VTEQVATPVVADAASVQLVAGVKAPVELVVKVTDPVGVVGVADVSVTVAVQLVGWLTTIDEGEQETLVVVGAFAVIARLKLLLLPVCVVSPA
jgi:hypothetical protein